MGWWLGIVALWTPINLFQTLREPMPQQASSGSRVETLFVWFTTVFAFLVKRRALALLVFALGQL
jgi:hypothetical protein